MKLQDAIIARIEQLRKQKRMSKYKLSMASGVPQTTLSSIIKKRSESIKLITLYWICEGFEISLEEFFHGGLFSREEISE